MEHGRESRGTSNARVLDWRAALARVDDDEALLRAMADAFLSACPDWLATIDGALRSEDMKALRFAAHAVKGAAQAIGGERVAELAKRLETAEPQATPSNFRDIHRELCDGVDALRRELLANITAPSPPRGSPRSPHGP